MAEVLQLHWLSVFAFPLTEVLTPADNSSRGRRCGNGNEIKSSLLNVAVGYQVIDIVRGDRRVPCICWH
jgi:hypothetical protein